MTQTYNIVFSGECTPEIPLERVKDNLAKLFRSEREAIDRLFQQSEVVLKRSLAAPEADKYLAALRQAGVIAYKAAQPAPAPSVALTLDGEPETAAPSPAANAVQPQAAPAPREGMCCPKCGQSQPQADTCTSCGVVIAKFLAWQARQVAMAPGPEQSPYAPPSAELDEHLPEFGELKVWSLSGRIGRLRYIAWSMAMLLIAGLVSVPFIALFAGSEVFGALMIGVAAIAAIVVSLMMGVQRLHDIGWTGWLILLTFVPVVGNILPLVLMIAPGSQGANRYGAPPPPNSTGVKVLAGLFFFGIFFAFAAAFLVGLPGLLSR